ncbi:MAG: chromosome partitioning protein [Jatrophihabitans sp.]|nr:MAG: chromosome partitioning protein [Jatrophihabitans sp.]
MRLTVLTAADGAPWETRWLAALESAPLGVTVARRCLDVVELLAVAASGQAQAALVTGSLRQFDADAVDRLRACSVAPVGVVRRGDEGAEQQLRAVGVEFLIPEDAEAPVVATVLAEAVRAAGQPEVAARAARTFAGGGAHATAVPPGSAAAVITTATRRGEVIAVWGPTGAPGRTTVAVNLADELGRLGLAALLIDADVYGGTIATVLGLLDESPGLAAACRQAAATGLDAAALAAHCWQLGPGLRVLTGMPIAARWPELRPAAVESVLDTARSLADFVVVDCGFSLETDEEISFDTLAPRRNGVTLAVLGCADVVLAVGAADPVGMQRLVRSLAELRDVDPAGTVQVVLNRVRARVVPGDPAVEVGAALRRFAGCDPAALLPEDRDALDAALAGGRSLAEARPNSALRRAVGEFAGRLAGVPAAPARRGRWR